MKLYLKIGIGIVVLAILWYLLSPLLLDIEKDDADPFANQNNTEITTNQSENQLKENSQDAVANSIEEKAMEMKDPDPEMVKTLMDNMDDEAKQMLADEAKESKLNPTEMDEPMPEVVKVVEEKAKEVSKNVTKSATKAVTKEIEKVKTQTKEIPKPQVTGPVLVSQAALEPNLHSVSGLAKIIKQDDQYIIRLEGFESVIGPGTNVYLATDKKASSFVDLGRLKANKGNINYQVAASKYNPEEMPFVLIWCKPFGVLFSYAELN